MTIPEQAIDAAAKAIADSIGHGMSEKCFDHARDALTAAAPHMSGVKVKQLEWTGAPNDAGRKGLWFIAIDHFGRQYEILKMFNGQKGEGWGYRSSWYPSLEAAKAAAQADYEKRILYALEPSSAREQALEEAAQIAELHEGEPCRPAIAWTDEERQFYASGQQDASSSIATAIRALKSQPATEFGSKELVNSFNRGYVIACANIVNMYGAKVEVAEGFAQLSITKSDFEALELCSYDKDAIKTLEEFAGEEKLFVSSDHTPQTGGGK